MDSLSSWAESTRSAFPESQTDPFHDFLGLIDVEFLTAVEFTNFRNNFTDVGRALSPAHGHVLGAGGTYIVRRIPFDASAHRVAALGEPWRYSNSGFVALKQQKLIDDRDSIVRVQDVDRMRAAMMEMKILRHQPIRNHPNIINLLQMRWDVQDDFRLVVPSVVMEIGDYGTLADFQDAEILALNSVTKKRICLDTARGLQFLHECGIVHGDVKSEYAKPLDPCGLNC
jgi:serine/threonine protein kinase